MSSPNDLWGALKDTIQGDPSNVPLTAPWLVKQAGELSNILIRPSTHVPLSDQWLAEKVGQTNPDSAVGALSRWVHGGADAAVHVAAAPFDLAQAVARAAVSRLYAPHSPEVRNGADFGDMVEHRMLMPPMHSEYGPRIVENLAALPPTMGGPEFQPALMRSSALAAREVSALRGMPRYTPIPDVPSAMVGAGAGAGADASALADAIARRRLSLGGNSPGGRYGRYAGPPARGAIMLPASKVAPERLDTLQRFVEKHGASSEQAYTNTHLLPMMKDTGAGEATSGLDDAWIVGDQNQRLADHVVKYLEKNPYGGQVTAPLGEVYPSKVMEQHYPDLMSRVVTLENNFNEPYTGSFDPSTHEIYARSPDIYGPEGIEGILGHEVTHAVQNAENLPMGGTSAGIRRRVFAAMQNNPEIKDWYNNRLIPHALRQRLPGDYLLYRALNGEQVAEAGAQLTGQERGLPRYTTPFAKHVLSYDEMESGKYYERLQALKKLLDSGDYSLLMRESPWVDLNR